MTYIAVNKKAFFDYEILETYEAGIELLGFEVKAVKSGRVSLGGSFVVVKDEEVWLLNSNIAPYQPKNTPNSYDPARSRKLLLKKSEIRELIGKASQKGLTIVPLRMYNKNRKIKLEIGIARHKKLHDKRETIKERDTRREIERSVEF